MSDEQFKGEDTVDEEGRNATQRRAEEEGTIWKDIGPADLRGEDGERESAEPTVTEVDPNL